MNKPYETIGITLLDGREYRVKAHDVAHDRAEYYVKFDSDTTYQEEYDYCIADSDELGDWLMNNMDWYELNPVLIRHDVPDLCDAGIYAKNYYRAR